MIYSRATVWWYEEGEVRTKDYQEVKKVAAAFDEKSLFIEYKNGTAIIKDWFFVETCK